jgi:hypothetical protein
MFIPRGIKRGKKAESTKKYSAKKISYGFV